MLAGQIPAALRGRPWLLRRRIGGDTRHRASWGIIPAVTNLACSLLLFVAPVLLLGGWFYRRVGGPESPDVIPHLKRGWRWAGAGSLWLGIAIIPVGLLLLLLGADTE